MANVKIDSIRLGSGSVYDFDLPKDAQITISSVTASTANLSVIKLGDCIDLWDHAHYIALNQDESMCFFNENNYNFNFTTDAGTLSLYVESQAFSIKYEDKVLSLPDKSGTIALNNNFIDTINKYPIPIYILKDECTATYNWKAVNRDENIWEWQYVSTSLSGFTGKRLSPVTETVDPGQLGHSRVQGYPGFIVLQYKNVNIISLSSGSVDIEPRAVKTSISDGPTTTPDSNNPTAQTVETFTVEAVILGVN